MSVTIFHPAPAPRDERSRREAVLRSGLVAAQTNERLAEIAQDMRVTLDADWAAVVVILDDLQHVIASTGGHIGPHRRAECLSSYVLLDPDTVFCVLDVAGDPAFSGSQFVREGLIAFYAGAAIVDDAGFPLGALCVTSRTPRDRFDAGQRAILMDGARSVLGRGGFDLA